MPSYQKVQNVAKRVVPRGDELRALVLKTMDIVAEIVGSTLGPGGRSVLIERQEIDLPPVVTKDGVTVFRSLGFQDSVMQSIMEAARDCAVRTASEAGDGTTTATVLANAIVHGVDAYCRKNPQRSPQQAIRAIEAIFRDVVEPTILATALPAKLDDEEGERRLTAVAKVSANGDEELAKATLDCFRICGDSGNVTLLEVTGPSRYVVESVDGYPIGIGWEDSLGKFYPKFLNEPEMARCKLQNPLFILYHGKIADHNQLFRVLENVCGGEYAEGRAPGSYVLVATGFSEMVLGALAVNFGDADSARVIPMVAPQLPVANSQLHFLEDLAAVVGAEVLDPLNRPLDTLTFEDMGAYQEEVEDKLVWRSRIDGFEMGRYRSSVFGHADDDVLADRVEQLEAVRPEIESELDARLLQERIAKLSGGIARLKIFGLSNGETKEKRDRAEDAVCAVRGALRFGILPGAGWMLLRLADVMRKTTDSTVAQEILAPAFCAPVDLLLKNAGYGFDETVEALKPVLRTVGKSADKAIVYDLLAHGHVNALKSGLFDSTPAVLESIRNSLSIATLLGALGGAVVFLRDREVERQEARDQAEIISHINSSTSTQRYQDEGVGDSLPEPAEVV